MKEELKQLIKEFYPYIKKRLGFDKSLKVKFIEDKINAQNPLGKTAFYNPKNFTITVFSTGRHIKDQIRSFAHECVHHWQNENGKFDTFSELPEGYAQSNNHLRKMEKEAYLYGNMIFRDWEDQKKKSLQEGTTYNMENKNMLNKIFENRFRKLSSLLTERFVGKKLKEEENSEATTSVPEYLAREMLNWHSGMGDDIYKAGSSAIAGKPVSVELLVNAIGNLESIYDRVSSEDAQSELDDLIIQLKSTLQEAGYDPDTGEIIQEELPKDIEDKSSKELAQVIDASPENDLDDLMASDDVSDKKKSDILKQLRSLTKEQKIKLSEEIAKQVLSKKKSRKPKPTVAVEPMKMKDLVSGKQDIPRKK